MTQTIIPLFDIKAQYHGIREELEPAVRSVLESGQYILGPEVSAFEEEFARYCGTASCIAVNSGTSALHLALLALGIGPGDQVIAPAMTFVATASAIDYVGATPVFVDIDQHTWTIDCDKIEAAITSKTKAIVPVHLHGRIADMDSIWQLAKHHGLLVIEDAAQAHGAKYTEEASLKSDAACYSFYAGKNLGACGEGGAVVTNCLEMSRRLSMLRDWGSEKKYHHDVKGFNYRMEGLQGAILRIKLRQLDGWTLARRAIADRYNAAFRDFEIACPAEEELSNRHVYHVYAVRVGNRDEVAVKLRAAGIGTGMHYPIPVHMQKCFAELGYSKGDFPEAEAFAADTISLPIYPDMTAEQIAAVIDGVKSIAVARR